MTQQQPPAPSAPPPMPPPPASLDYAQAPPRTDLHSIARNQKAVMYCILAYIGLVILQFVVPAPLNIILAVLTFAVSITAAVFVFMLALSLYSTGVGILLGILTLIPLLGVIVLLVINGKATNVLRDHGIQVGLMGAKTDQIPAPGQAPMR